MYKQAGIYVRKTRLEDIVFNVYFTELRLPWTILLPGLPQYVHKQWYLRELIKSHCILNPYYPGSFHSYGRFNVKSLRQVIPKSIEFLKSREFYDFFDKVTYKHEGVLDSILALSFGCNVLLDHMINFGLPEAKPIFISPLIQLSNPVQKRYWTQKLNFLGTEVYGNVYRHLVPEEILNWMKQMETKRIKKPHRKGIIVLGKNDKWIEKGFLKEKLSGFKIKEVKGLAHEVDNLTDLFIKNLWYK